MADPTRRRRDPMAGGLGWLLTGILLACLLAVGVALALHVDRAEDPDQPVVVTTQGAGR